MFRAVKDIVMSLRDRTDKIIKELTADGELAPRSESQQALLHYQNGAKYALDQVLVAVSMIPAANDVYPTCRCPKPLIGEHPGHGARCRLCNGYIGAKYIMDLVDDVARMRGALIAIKKLSYDHEMSPEDALAECVLMSQHAMMDKERF
jgi:hypothetical protein